MSGWADGPVPATTGARSARSSATRIHHRNGEPMTSTGAAGARRAGRPACATSWCSSGGWGPCAGWVRSSSQLSQSGVSAIADGAGTPRRSARSRTMRYRSGAAFSAIGTVGLTAGRARATTRATPAASSRTRTATGVRIRRARSQPGPGRWPVDPPTSRITAAAAGSRATARARLRMRSTASARERALRASASLPTPLAVMVRPHPLPAPDAVLALPMPPLWHPPLTSQCRWAKCRNACAAP